MSASKFVPMLKLKSDESLENGSLPPTFTLATISWILKEKIIHSITHLIDPLVSSAVSIKL